MRKFFAAILVLMIIEVAGAKLPQKGDHVAIITESGMVQEVAIGNITDMNENLICLNCTSLMKSTTISSTFEDEGLNYPKDLCIALNRIVGLTWI